MKLQRVIGTTSQILNVFVQDATVSTGAGLANITNPNYSWFHNNQAAVSTGVASTAGAMGIFSTSAWVQVSSSNALGWYQFGAPDGLWSTGDAVALHIYGAASMAPLPIEVELTRTNDQQFASSTVFLAYTSSSPATISGTSNVNVIQIQGSNAVTSSAGVLNVSTQTIDKTGYSIVGTTFANIVQIYSQAAVTSASGILNVSTQTIDKTGYTLAGTTNVNVIQIQGANAVTSGAGILNVSTQTIDKTGYSLGGTTMANIVQIYSQPAVTSASGILTVSTQTLSAGADNTGIANASSAAVAASSALYGTLAESYRGNGSTGTIAQLMYEMVAHMGEAAIVVTTKTINTIGHTSAAMTFQLNSSTAPTSVTRIT
jgi:hypothetical protein